MTSIDTIRLIILNNSRTEAERLISMLHNAGRPSRAQHVDSEEALVKLLQEQTWDLLIGNDNTTNPTPQIALKHIRRLNKDVPVILLHEDEELFARVEGMKMGAVDVVNLDDDQHLLLVIQREMNNRHDRQARRSADRRFREAERRSQQLLDSSRDAIAYVQDGLYLYANESFAELFGYENRDEIEAMPIMDMVADSEQNKLKNFLKEFSLKGEDGGASQLAFGGVMQDGTPTAVNLEVSHVTYDEEPCIQFLARATRAEISSNNEELQAQIDQIKSQDLVTGLFNRQHMMQMLEHTIDHIGDQQSLSLLYINLDNFNERVSSAYGVAGSDLVLGDISAVLRNKSTPTDILARFGDHSFTILLTNIKADAAVNRAVQLCKAIDQHIIEVDGKTIQLTCSIGVSIVNETSTSASTVIEQARVAMEKVSSAQGNSASLFEPEVTDKAQSTRDIAVEIQQALDNDKFRLLFQPIISLRGSEEEYYEVYLRMLNEAGVEIEPDDFLEEANKINLSIKIDRWVILESIKMLSQHRAKGNKTKLIVNLGRQSLCDDTLLPWLAVAFKAAKLAPDSITFQANEVDVTNHLNAAKAFADGLAKMKTQMSITNFGCSLNPFNALKHVAAGMIKIDGSFTTDIQHKNESSAALIELIEKLHAENKVTIVPFVENASVLSTLWQAGAHYIQGHYLQEPSQNLNYDFNMES
ncbi:EAL domain-containing protein [Cellvibrio sp.]|uniref:EAL domain-containing response regulator n=1 Tax=Cellvibrio sp. TaxID=1965322 RepID=UPI0039647701